MKSELYARKYNLLYGVIKMWKSFLMSKGGAEIAWDCLKALK